jgi:hypothetical protein
MSMFDHDNGLVEQVARDAGIPTRTLQSLLELEREFPNLSARNAKRRLAERVEEVISEGLGAKD